MSLCSFISLTGKNAARLRNHVCYKGYSCPKSLHGTVNTIKCNSRKSGTLSITIMKNAAHFILFHLQQKIFSKEIEALKATKLIKTSSKLQNLKPFAIDDLLRVGGQKNQATLTYNQKPPIVFPSYSHVTSLLIKSANIALGHS